MCKVGQFSLCGTEIQFFDGAPTGIAPAGTLGFDITANNKPYIYNGGWHALSGGTPATTGGLTTFEPNVKFFPGVPTGSAAKGTIGFDIGAGYTMYVFNGGWQLTNVQNGGSLDLQSVCGPNIIFFPPGPPPASPPPPNGTIGVPSGGPPYVYHGGGWHPIPGGASILRELYANFVTPSFTVSQHGTTFPNNFTQDSRAIFGGAVTSLAFTTGVGFPIRNVRNILVPPATGNIPRLKNAMLAKVKSLIGGSGITFIVEFEVNAGAPAHTSAWNPWRNQFGTPTHTIALSAAWNSAAVLTPSNFAEAFQVGTGTGSHPSQPALGPGLTNRIAITYDPTGHTVAICSNGAAATVGTANFPGATGPNMYSFFWGASVGNPAPPNIGILKVLGAYASGVSHAQLQSLSVVGSALPTSL